MHVSGRPVGSFDNEGLIFAAGVDAEIVRLYDLRSFDKVFSRCERCKYLSFVFYDTVFFTYRIGLLFTRDHFHDIAVRS